MLRRPDRRFSPEGWQKIAGGKPAPPPEHPPNVACHPEGVTDHRGGPLNTDSTCDRPPKIGQGTHRLFPAQKSTMSPIAIHKCRLTPRRGDRPSRRPFEHGFHVRLAPENSARDAQTLPNAEKYNVPLLRFKVHGSQKAAGFLNCRTERGQGITP